MSINAKRLLEISQDVGFKEISSRIEKIANIKESKDCPLMLPLVGEFSSGKTTLINSLTDSKALETATKPTTATIFEVHFGSKNCKAVVMDNKGNSQEINDISALKNSELVDNPVVTIFDTSNKVPSSIVLVDTPGLSSPDPRHKQTLVDFLPQADAILLVADINAQLTRSLTDFVKTMSLSNRRIYLVLTKIDTKSASDVVESKKYLEDTLHVHNNNIVCISAEKDNLTELLSLLERIQSDKAEILDKVNERRLQMIVNDMSAKIDELLKVPDNDDDIKEQISEKKLEINRIQRNIEKVISSAKDDIEDIQGKYSRKFEDTVSSRLESLASGKRTNFDAEAVSTINNTASLILNEYKDDVKRILHSHALNNNVEGIDMSALDALDVSNLRISGLSYNLELNKLGHQYDGYISTGLKVAAVVAAVAVTAGAASAAAGAEVAGTGAAEMAGTGAAEVASTAAGTELLADATTISTVASVADTATDVGSIMSNNKLMNKISKIGNLAQEVGDNYVMIENAANSFGGSDDSGGFVKSMVGFVTDKAMGKPQRRRAIHNYMDSTLTPQFKAELNKLTRIVVDAIRNTLNQNASNDIKEMAEAISKLRESLKKHSDDFEHRITELRNYKNELALM